MPGPSSSSLLTRIAVADVAAAHHLTLPLTHLSLFILTLALLFPLLFLFHLSYRKLTSKMDNPKDIDSTRVAAAMSPAAILRAQPRIGSDDGHMSSPTKGQASPDIPRHPRSTGEYSDRVRSGAIHSSTPQSQSIKYVTLTPDFDDPFSTPSQTDISGDRSLTTPSTAPQSTSSVEIFLGPQPLPFVHNRHRLLMDQYHPSPSRSRTKTGDLPSLLGRKSKSPAPPVSSSTAPAVQEPDTKNTAAVGVSKWRAEQLKKVKSPRIVPGSRERHIPLLHGPLSLPYSRNPSGVDATVADQSAYLSHVFGLRMANSPDGKTSIKSSNPGSRVASDSTTARTVSSSSYLSTSTGYMSATTDNTSLSYASSGKRPVVVRDHNQIIGIKKDVVPIPTEPVPVASLQLAQSLGAPKSVDVRSQLGLGQSCPTKPKAKAPKAPQAQDEAIHSARSSAWPINPAEPTPIMAAPAVFKTLTLVDPTTGQIYNVRVLQQQPEAGSRFVSGDSTLSSKLSTPPHAASSKADTSINWRNKTSKPSPLQSILTAPPPSATSSSAIDAPVLTVNHLYEKFGQKRDITSPSPLVSTGDPGDSKSLSESTSGNVNIPAGAETPVKTRRRGARQGKGRGKIDPTTKAKGTPGAGKHLMRAHDDENSPSPMSASSTPSKSPPPRKPRSQRKTGSPKKAAAVTKT